MNNKLTIQENNLAGLDSSEWTASTKVEAVILLLTEYFEAEFVQWVEHPEISFKKSSQFGNSFAHMPWLCIPYKLENRFERYEKTISSFLDCIIKYVDKPI